MELTKEGFWNRMKTKYPQQFVKFAQWIDEYKEKNGWDKLFNAQKEHQDEDKWDYEKNGPYVHPEVLAPKFHNLPIAMQAGIFMQFAMETDSATPLELVCKSLDDIPTKIEEWMGINESLNM